MLQHFPIQITQEVSFKEKTLWRSLGILDRWHTKTFDDFTNDPIAKKRVLHYLETADTMKANGIGLFFHGVNGVGKTHLAMCLLKELGKRFSVRAITLGTLIGLYTQGWYDREKHQEYLDIISKPDFLELEEIGKEYKSNNSDLGLSVLDTVVRYRLQAMKPLVFTTNLPPKIVTSTYSHDIGSMLHECSLIIEVKGTDRRVAQFEDNKRRYDV